MRVSWSSCKMGPRCIGPFKVLRQINNVAYEITLPPNSRVHPVFHVYQLRKFLGEALSPADPILSLNPGKLEYEVESILQSRTSQNNCHFLVKWKGYPIKEASWEPKSNLSSCAQLLAKFLGRSPGLVGGDVKVLTCITPKNMHQ